MIDKQRRTAAQYAFAVSRIVLILNYYKEGV